MRALPDRALGVGEQQYLSAAAHELERLRDGGVGGDGDDGGVEESEVEGPKSSGVELLSALDFGLLDFEPISSISRRIFWRASGGIRAGRWRGRGCRAIAKFW